MKKVLFMAWALLMVAAMQAATVTFSASELDNASTSATKDGVTIVLAQGSGESAPSWNSSQSTMAAVAGNTLTISAAEGYEVKQALISLKANSQANNLVAASWDSGKATASGAQVTWKGTAESVSVTLTGVARFMEFEVTYAEKEAPIVEDESKYNDTTEVTIAEWMEYEGLGGGDNFDETSYTKKGKTLYFLRGNGSTPKCFSDGCSPHLYFHYDNTLRIESMHKMHKVVFDFCSEENAESFFNAETPDAGKLVLNEKQVIWLGENRQMNWKNARLINGRREIDVDNFIGITIITDTTDTQVTITFYDFDGQVLKSEQVTVGSSVTPPTIDDECFDGWDRSTTKVMDNMDVHPKKKVLVSLTAEEMGANRGEREMQKGDFTFRFNVGDFYDDEPAHVELDDYFIVTNPNWLYNLTFECMSEAAAQSIATSICSSGSLSPDGAFVHWTGSTDSLVIRWGWIHIISVYSECQHFDHFTVTFLGEDDNPISTQVVAPGSDAIAPSDPKSDNTCKIFTGWDTKFTNVRSDLTIKPLWQELEDCVPEGYVEVIFVDANGNTIDRQAVPIGGAAVAPEAPSMIAHKFIGWSAPLTNITESQTIQAQYAFDKDSPDIMTVPQWVSWTEEHRWDYGTQVIVKGIVHDVVTKLEEGGKLTFRFSEDGENDWENNQPVAYGAHILGVNGQSFANHLQLEQGDTVYVFGTYGREDIDFGYYYYYSQEVVANGHLAYLGKAKESEDKFLFYGQAPDAALLYDFSGNGLKQIVSFSTESMGEEVEDYRFTIWASGDASQLFSEREKLGSGIANTGMDVRPLYFEDINHDGKTDVSTIGSVFLSNADGYTKIDQSLAVTNMDINRDGRPDYLLLDRSASLTSGYANYGCIMYQRSDGSFQEQRMQVMTWDEFVAQMTPEELDQYNNPQNYSLGDVSRYTYTIQLGGASLARAPRGDARRAPGIGTQVDAPTKAIDMNGDGLVDLIDEKAGIIYTNMDNGKWVWTQTNGAVIPVDLNADGVTDFIFPGAKLYTSIYDKTKNTFVTTMLYQNATVDDRLYCYDFDKDGDIDILATFSAPKNATGYAYTCFFLNDGQGQFTQQPEQSYGNLTFSACQDINGDGYMDLLAFRSAVTVASESSSEVEVVWLQGNTNNSFAAPQRLYSFYIYNGWSDPRQVYDFISHARIHAEDLDNNGQMDIWVSDVYDSWGGPSGLSYTEIYPMKTAVANTRPTAPTAPVLSYKDGQLTITWGNGSDKETAVGDLTYAIRIGSTAGGNDILAAHANKDGSRRNFLDGNMGKLHEYTIDLSSYDPSTIYVAVQAIDAQHIGSAWSDEATVKHSYLPVDFTLSSDKIAFNESVKVYYTALPEGYKHQWEYADGVLLRDESYLHLKFPTAGEKTIKHTVIAPDSQTASTEKTLTVLPAGLGEAISSNEVIDHSMADYTFDGRLDGVLLNGNTMTVQEGIASDQLFVGAAGLWNTNIPSGDYLWYDWNRDGKVDLVFNGSALLHDATQPTLTALQEDENLIYMFSYSQSGLSAEDYYYGRSLRRDFTHNGLYDMLMEHPRHNVQLVETDGKGGAEWYNFDIEGDQDWFQSAMDDQTGRYAQFIADFDHDGWTDIAVLHLTNSSYTGFQYSGLDVFYNRGSGKFVQQFIPFAQTVLRDQIYVRVEDLNGDGYLDVLFLDNEVAILWNNGNQSFSSPEVLPNSANSNNTVITDMDNNGYPDIVSVCPNPALGEYFRGTYVWYMGAQGLQTHGFIIPDGWFYKDVYLANGDHRLLADKLYPIVTQADERPAAPTGLAAEMTDEGLLITWNAAVDDHTPTALMRYNLAVKEQGATTYLISPQNGMNVNAAYMPDYAYIHATQFLIPTTYLSNGNYEISLQALDLQNRLSLFSEQLVTTVTRNPIEVPESACANEEVVVTYRGAETTGTPVWNWDGGQATGSGFGPYTVVWTTGGEKTITLTLNGQTYTVKTTIDDPKTLEVTIPSVLYEGITASASVPDGIEYNWFVSIDGSELYPIDNYGILLPSTSVFVSYDYRLSAQGLNVTAHYRSDYTDKSLVGHQVRLYLHVTNTNGCDINFYSDVTVLASTNIPTLTLVTTDANGHNVLSWTNTDVFATVNVYKEGNALNDFQLIGSANAAEGAFTDANSDATQKAERYYVTGVMANGDESPASTIHKTVHLTINRGVMNGTFNLIWNEYAGAAVSAYRILRGESPTNLVQIAVVASSNTSFTDQAPVDAQPYYAIEYVLSAAAAAPAHHINRAPQAELAGRSNVVNRKDLGEGIENIADPTDNASKILREGHIYIRVSDHTFDATGRLIK